MSYEQALQEVAKKHELGSTLVTGHKSSYFKEAAELFARSYGESKWNEACEAQQLVYFNHVNNEVKPEFKP